MTCLIDCASLSGSHKEDELLPSGQSFHHRRHARIRTQSSQRLRGHGGAVPLHEEKVGNLNLLKMGEAHSVSSNLSHFYPNRRWCFSKKCAFMYDDIWPFLAIFGYFGTIKHLKRRKYTNCNYLGAISSKKYMKMASYSDLEIWS